MIDCHEELVAALNTVLPTHYELTLHSGLSTPCISYQEANNYDTVTGDTIGYSKIAYTIKVWATDIKTIQKYVVLVDKVLKPLGLIRTSSNELGDKNSSMIQKIMTYQTKNECLEHYD